MSVATLASTFLPIRVVLAAFAVGLLSTQSPCAQGGEYGEEVLRNRAATFFRGPGSDRCQGVWELSNGDILIAGETTSRTFNSQFPVTPTPAYTSHSDPEDSNPSTLPGTATEFDGYVAILDPTLSTVKHWTYIGGVGQDRAYFAMEDANQNI
jgi:hypothetical protein